MKRNILLKTKRKFFLRIYLDIILTFSIIVLGISIPLGLASFFTPDWIYYKGCVLTWIHWAVIIVGISVGLVLISDWLISRWRSSKKQAEAEVKNE